MPKKFNGTVIVTYRCNARCNMCSRYLAPSRPEEELTLETIRKLPRMYFTNITGGEPFIREDLPEIVRERYKKSDRIVISTNGFFTDRRLPPGRGDAETAEGHGYAGCGIRHDPPGPQRRGSSSPV